MPFVTGKQGVLHVRSKLPSHGNPKDKNRSGDNTMLNTTSTSKYLTGLLAILLSACGGGGGGDSDSGNNSSAGPNRDPVAVTDAEIDLARNSAAFLDGSASSDADLDALTFTWTQTGGADITGS